MSLINSKKIVMKNMKVYYLIAILFLTAACSENQESFIKSIEDNDLKKVKSHIEAKIDLNELTPTGETLLMIAAQKADENIINELINGGAEINALDGKGNTALMLACKSKKAANVSALLDNKADPYLLNSEGQSFMSYSADNPETGAIIDQKLFLDDQLYTLSGTGKPTQIDSLIELGANVNSFESLHYTPLFNAVYNGNFENVEMLFKKGADKDFKNLKGETALDFAKYIFEEEMKSVDYTYEDLGVSRSNAESIISDENLFAKKMKELRRNMNRKGSSYHTSLLAVSSFNCAVKLNKLKGLKTVITMLEE